MPDTEPSIRALVVCQVPECASEVSYPLDMVRKLNGQPICEECYLDQNHADLDPSWDDLPPVTLLDLYA